MKDNSLDKALTKLFATLERDPRVNMHKGRLVVRSEHDKVILDGEVDNIIAKRVATDIAARSLPRWKWPIVDQLRVTTTEPREDRELRDKVVLALTNEPVFSDYTLHTNVLNNAEKIRDKGISNQEIMVTIQDGSITLSGHVGSLTHRRLAEVLMWWTDGCQIVDNQLEVVPPEQDNDGEITDAVRMVLEKDPFVHASQLVADTAGGVVVLNGSVASAAEKRLAVLDAWYVPGVVDVVDRVQARS